MCAPQAMTALLNGTLIYFAIGVLVTLVSFFIPVCRSDQSCAATGTRARECAHAPPRRPFGPDRSEALRTPYSHPPPCPGPPSMRHAFGAIRVAGSRISSSGSPSAAVGSCTTRPPPPSSTTHARVRAQPSRCRPEGTPSCSAPLTHSDIGTEAHTAQRSAAQLGVPAATQRRWKGVCRGSSHNAACVRGRALVSDHTHAGRHRSCSLRPLSLVQTLSLSLSRTPLPPSLLPPSVITTTRRRRAHPFAGGSSRT